MPVLISMRADFKVAETLSQIIDLNSGQLGVSQAGKFITIYPIDDDHAVNLARRLDEATHGLRGPAIPSDRRLKTESLVHYRFGAFESLWLQTPIGEIVPALVGPDGFLEADRRNLSFCPPPWALPDPFREARLGTPVQKSNLMISERYLVGSLIFETPENRVLLAADCLKADVCIIKQTKPGVASIVGRRLLHEARMLRALAGIPRLPALRDEIEEADCLSIIIDYLPGRTLESALTEIARHGKSMSMESVIVLMAAIAQTLDQIHSRGIVFGDLKSSNIILDKAGKPWLIDFEAAAAIGQNEGILVGGTPGHISPQRQMGGAPSVLDDVYSFGAVFYNCLTCAEPSSAPDRTRLLDRDVMLMNPSASPHLRELAIRCLDPRPHKRPLSMQNVRECLEFRHTLSPAPLFRLDHPTILKVEARRIVLELVEAVGPSEHGPGLTWSYDSGDRDTPAESGIELGFAGIVLMLTEAAPVLNEPEIWHALEQSAIYLRHFRPVYGPEHPGLYVGEAGVGLALLRAGIVLSDTTLVSAAEERGRKVANLPHSSPDLFNGTAGRLRFHAFLWEVTGDDEHLNEALKCRDRLLTIADQLDGNQIEWRIPPGYGSASGKAFLGYAHGCAGIGDALLDLEHTSSNPETTNAVRCVVNRLAATAITSLDSDNGVEWPSVVNGGAGGAFWCHGAAGIARFVLRAWKRGGIAESEEIALRAAKTTAAGARWAGACQCHGLAGNMEVLLDFYQATGENEWLDKALELSILIG